MNKYDASVILTRTLVDRVAYFQYSLEEKGGEPLSLEAVQELVHM